MMGDQQERVVSQEPPISPLDTHHSPRVSVVIPTLNRPALLDRCLRSLFTQTLPIEQYEVIVVDDGPHLSTEVVVQRWERHHPEFNLAYVASVHAHGPAAARNLGW